LKKEGENKKTQRNTHKTNRKQEHAHETTQNKTT